MYLSLCVWPICQKPVICWNIHFQENKQKLNQSQFFVRLLHIKIFRNIFYTKNFNFEKVTLYDIILTISYKLEFKHHTYMNFCQMISFHIQFFLLTNSVRVGVIVERIFLFKIEFISQVNNLTHDWFCSVGSHIWINVQYSRMLLTAHPYNT